MTSANPYILLDDQLTQSLRYYTTPVAIIAAKKADDVASAFEALKKYHHDGYYLAGYLSYDLGFALEPKLAPLMPKTLNGPLLQFGVFKTVSDHAPAAMLYSAETPTLDLKPLWTEANYAKRFQKVMDYIQAGDVYQINLTFPMRGPYEGSADNLYAAFRHRQKGRYGGIVSLNNGPEIISLSPELFFRKTDDEMSMRPMKGTRPRSDDLETDNFIREDMRAEIKSQAENLMIVDLLRNDLSRISKAGSVNVPELFSLETYPTLHQMTSRVTSTLNEDTDFADIFKSLFPCGSVTGAPKIRAMEIIDELEGTARGAYCGSLGYIDPNGDACFNVGIRTLMLDNNQLRYNIGSGLVLDSKASDEYAECLLKADVIRPEKSLLIETLKWDPVDGFIRKERHIKRLIKSAKALNYPLDKSELKTVLNNFKKQGTAQRVRITLSEDGILSLTSSKLNSIDNYRISISKYPLTDKSQITSHKISQRQFYDGERERISAKTGADEVIFLNERDELCEGSFTSLFLEKNGQLLTPSLNCGLLLGILREDLIEKGEAKEAILKLEDLIEADKVYVGNSLRGLIPAEVLNMTAY